MKERDRCISTKKAKSALNGWSEVSLDLFFIEPIYNAIKL